LPPDSPGERLGVEPAPVEVVDASHVPAAHVTPAGHLVITAQAHAEGPEKDGLDSAARARLLGAMARGEGHAVLHLGLVHVDSVLGPSLSMVRDLGKRFVTRLCADPDVDDKRERAVPGASDDDLAAVLDALPPMLGAEYVTTGVLRAWWDAAAAAFGDEMRSSHGSVQEWLRSYGSAWNVVGKVCFHLAENPGDAELPFAFLATYATRTTARGKVAHVPLSRALADSSARADKASLLSLLVPVQRAAEHSALVKQLLDDGDLYHPMAWSPAEAHRFLREMLEAAGVIVRVPDWWRARRPPRPEVQVTVGGNTASHRTGFGARWPLAATAPDAAPCHRARRATALVVCLNHSSHGVYPLQL
jgi:hypothetical protein